MLNNNLEQHYDYCERIIKENSKSFYTAFSKLPEAKAKVVYALYAFCRYADDIVDSNDSHIIREAALQQLSTEFEDFLYGKTPQSSMWICMEDVFKRYPMDADAFRLQIKGQYFDLNFKQPKSLDELETYSYHVAASVGFMMLPIIATKNYSHLHEAASDLGIAMQITNILRDIGEDYQTHKRIYLPEDLMRKYQIDDKMIADHMITAHFISLWEVLAHAAEEKYDRFFERIHDFDEDSRFQIIVAAKVYREILNEIRANNYNFLLKRNFVSKQKMLRIVLETKESVK